MKKTIALLLVFILVLGMVACGNKAANSDTFEIAMITDVGTIDDKSFNQGTWEGILAFAEKEEKTHKYYKPTEQTTNAYLDSIALAVQGGAKVVVTPGYLFEAPIFQAQDQYPDVKFILIDGYPNNGDYSNFEEKTGSNTVGVKFAEEESGYLAGYAAVKEGYRKLGFMGGMAVPAVVRFGYGFVQGAEAAAEEMGIEAIELKYHYTGGFEATPEAQTLAASWYAGGTEVIFACGGAVGNSVMSAAAAKDGKVIGVDVDQSSESETVITSAMKGLGAAVEEMLTLYYEDKFPGGENLVLDASSDGVSLPMDTSKFEVFTQEEYDAVFAKLASGSMKLLKDDVDSAVKLGTKIVTVIPVQ